MKHPDVTNQFVSCAYESCLERRASPPPPPAPILSNSIYRLVRIFAAMFSCLVLKG
jgi:hypothetical protein